MHCCLEPQKEHCIGFYQCNVVTAVLRQHCTGYFSMHVVWSLLNNTAHGFYLCNNVPRVSLGTTLQRILCSVDLEAPDNTVYEKILVNVS